MADPGRQCGGAARRRRLAGRGGASGQLRAVGAGGEAGVSGRRFGGPGKLPANGRWQVMLPVVNACCAFEIVAHASVALRRAGTPCCMRSS